MKQILCNKYEVLKTIAEGGLGVVYLVKDLHLNKLAAVKVGKNPGNEREREFAFREREVLKELSHPALPGIIDYFEERENSFLVMEYVEGITLEQYLRKFGTVEVSLAVKWTIELAEVLQYLHSCNPPIIYRDLKPANIMIQQNGKIKLIDFGAAFVTSYGQTKEQMLVGTPGYSSPEQWQWGNAGKTSDVYGLGAVLHEMVTGICPAFPAGQRRPVREYDRGISRELEKVISICTRKRPQERYQSMEQLKRALLGYEKKGRGKQALFLGKKLIGWGLIFSAALCFFLPLLKGVGRETIPFPYLTKPLLLSAVSLLYQVLFLRRRQDARTLKRQEKSVFLTEKKFSGIYVAGILIMTLGSALLTGVLCLSAAAQGKENSLWVEMRDEKDRKLLLKEGAVYPVGDKLRLEIPAERMPEGKITLWVAAAGEEGETYRSRRFLLTRGKREE